MSGVLGRQKSRRGGYRRLGRQLSVDVFEEREQRVQGDLQLGKSKSKKEEKPAGASKKGTVGEDAHAHAHPVQRVLDARRMDKAMAKPEFVRYLAYMKEAGRWEGGSDHPVIFFD